MKLNRKALEAIKAQAANAPVRRSLNETQARELREDGLVVVELGGSQFEVSTRDGRRWDITHSVGLAYTERGVSVQHKTVEQVQTVHEKMPNTLGDVFSKLGL